MKANNIFHDLNTCNPGWIHRRVRETTDALEFRSDLSKQRVGWHCQCRIDSFLQAFSIHCRHKAPTPTIRNDNTIRITPYTTTCFDPNTCDGLRWPSSPHSDRQTVVLCASDAPNWVHEIFFFKGSFTVTDRKRTVCLCRSSSPIGSGVLPVVLNSCHIFGVDHITCYSLRFTISQALYNQEHVNLDIGNRGSPPDIYVPMFTD